VITTTGISPSRFTSRCREDPMPPKRIANPKSNTLAVQRYYERNRGGRRYKAILEQTRRRRQQRREILDSLKAEPCADCGQSFPTCCMDFDHVRGVKKAAISSMLCGAADWERLCEELDKCDMVCSNCHRIRTARRAGKCV
jgi:hypothetical protein